MAEPRSMKSRTEIDDPNRDLPNTANEDPTREKDLRDIDAPSWMISTTDNEEPKRAKPITDNVEPYREKLRRDNDAPI
jgi:hypothetical protein